MSRPHLEPGVMVNIVDITFYLDGVKITFGDSPDSSERNAQHRGSFFMSNDTGRKLLDLLTRCYGRTPIPEKKEPNVVED